MGKLLTVLFAVSMMACSAQVGSEDTSIYNGAGERDEHTVDVPEYADLAITASNFHYNTVTDRDGVESQHPAYDVRLWAIPMDQENQKREICGATGTFCLVDDTLGSIGRAAGTLWEALKNADLEPDPDFGYLNSDRGR